MFLEPNFADQTRCQDMRQLMKERFYTVFVRLTVTRRTTRSRISVRTEIHQTSFRLEELIQKYLHLTLQQ